VPSDAELRALISKWRDSAQMPGRSYGLKVGLKSCANELESLLPAAGEEPELYDHNEDTRKHGGSCALVRFSSAVDVACDCDAPEGAADGK
jgi:hypothetical protein